VPDIAGGRHVGHWVSDSDILPIFQSRASILRCVVYCHAIVCIHPYDIGKLILPRRRPDRGLSRTPSGPPGPPHRATEKFARPR